MKVLVLAILSIVGSDSSDQLSISRRSHRQELNGYVVDYQIRNVTSQGMVITPSDIELKTDGWVSNSSLAFHGVPRRSSVVVKPDEKMPGICTIVHNENSRLACNEKVSIAIWSDDAIGNCEMPELASTVSLAPGGSGLIRVLFEHAHGAFGKYEMLLGDRKITLRVGQDVIEDVVSIRSTKKLYPPSASYEPSDRFIDKKRYVSAPTSLHLRLHEPGYGYHSFLEQTVRFDSRMRLRFRYLTAVGTHGEVKVRLSQYSTSPSGRGYLTKGGLDEVLPVIGEWTTVERIVKTEPDAGSLRLDFRIMNFDNSETGEAWIDDISFEVIDDGHVVIDRSP